MSERVCYIRRTDRGAALKGLRLIGAHTDDAWTAGGGGDPGLIVQTVSEAAAWIRERLNAGSGPSKSLGVLCLDPDGAVCSWVKPDDADPAMLDAAITSGGAYDPESLEPVPQAGLSERFPRLPLELSFELLNPDETSTGSRSAVMAAPDVPGRLLKDALDASGVRIERFTTIWHALANVWDPGAGAGEHSAQRIVSSDAPIAAVIALDPIDGRLIWSWSREGRLICAGGSRVRVARREREQHAVLRDEDIARLCGDWLGWSSQLGVSPSRIVFVGRPEQIRAGPEGDNEGPQIGLDAPAIGAALGRAWPEATIDLIGEDDPVGETLRRIGTGARGQDLTSLDELTNRPTRAHRSMYRWAGLALAGVAAIIAIFAFQLFSHADQLKAENRRIASQRTELLNSFDPELVLSRLPQRDLEIMRDQIRSDQGPIQVEPSKPILRELETISFVLGTPGIEIDKITLHNRTVTLTVSVDDVGRAEQLNQNLRSIRGSRLDWYSMTPAPRGNKVQATYLANWNDEEVAS